MTYYDILQVSMEASDEVIKAAYKSLVKKYHPDSGIESDVNQFLKVEEAYETLSDSESRKKYDESLRAEKKEEKIQVKEPEGFFTSAEKNTETKKRKRMWRWSAGNIFESLFGFLFWVFVIYSWFGNAEKIRVELLNLARIQTYSDSEDVSEVYFSFEYDTNFLKNRSDVWINIDGNRVQLLAYGDDDEYLCKLSKGQHIVFIETKTLHVNSKKHLIQVEENEEFFQFKIKGRSMWGAELYN